MSNLEPRCASSDSRDCPAPPPMERIASKKAMVGESLPISRALPGPRRRMIGAWCFLDHAGPVGPGSEMRVGPHPHIGLQTFTWMIEGKLLHRDSLGYEQLIAPGQVNLMTAGRGISHSEESVAVPGQGLHLAQLWIALPDAQRWTDSAFEHYPVLPQLSQDGFALTVLAGEFGGMRAPTRVHTPLLGLDLRSEHAADTTLNLNPGFEYGLMMLSGETRIEGEVLASGELLYLGPGRTQIRVASAAACQLLLIGGEPFAEPVLLWWNFVGRTQDEIAQATADWNEGERFGQVRGYPGARLTAPDISGLHLRGA
ncbi:MAG: pirin family protein [Panacagrimonas sp.]